MTPIARADQGLTMIELMVYIALAGLVLAIVGGLMFNLQSTQATVTDAARAANTGQLVLRTIENGVRNASAVSVTESGALLRLQAVNATGTGTTCQAWYFDAANERMYTTTAATSAGIVVADAPTTWILMGEHIVDTGAPGAFELTGQAVRVTLTMESRGQSPIELVATTTPRVPNAVPPPNCID